MTRNTERRPGTLAAAVLALVSAPLLAEKPDVTAKIGSPGLAPGEKGTVVVEMTMGKGWHVNSHEPLEEFLVPTLVTLATSTGRRLSVTYPAGQARRFAFSEKPLSVYAGTVRFEAELAVPPDAHSPLALSGEVSYQACNDVQCFAPAKLPLSATVTIR
jgi:uncharacterized protein